MKQHKKECKPPLCPYCGRISVLRPAEYVYGKASSTPEGKLYVCSGYPACQAYVGVHEGTLKPKGTLADGELRNKRIQAHRVMERIVRSGCMSRNDVYWWLSSRLNLPFKETHIGYFSDYYCEQTIAECEHILKNWEGKRGRAAA